MKKMNMRNNNTKGLLITFCGLDGCGKTTMINKLKRDLSQYEQVILTKQPTDFVRQSKIFRTYMAVSYTHLVLGYNLFAYCENNPVIYHDPDGYFVITTTMLICAGIGALVFGTIGGIVGYQLSKKWKVPKGKRWKYVLGGVVIGAVSGALIGGAI